LLVFAGCGGGAVAAPQVPAAPSVGSTQAAAQSAIQTSTTNLQAAWNAGNAAAWTAEFWSDAHFVNILGVSVDGSAAIQQLHTKLFAGPFLGSTLSGAIKKISFASNDVAIVNFDTQVTGYKALPPGASATSPGVLDTTFTLVYTRRSGAWHIASAQNTALAPAAAAPSPTPA
jgi:uncharacterized protein (TIGR02246 family)